MKTQVLQSVTQADVITLTHQDMIARADEKIADAANKMRLASEQMNAAHAQKVAMEQRQAELKLNIQHKTATVVECLQALERASTYATLALDTPAEQSAVAALSVAKHAHEEATLALNAVVSINEQEVQEAYPVLASLDATIIENQMQVQALSELKTNLQIAREQAHQALGQETYEHLMAQINALQEQTTAQRSVLLDSKLSLNSVLDIAYETLRPWPRLREEAQRTYNTYQDGTTRFLGAYLAFLEVLEMEGPSITRTLGFQHTFALCSLNENAMAHIIDFRGSEGTQKLTERRGQIKQALALHIQSRG